jgi:hypothetical protein
MYAIDFANPWVAAVEKAKRRIPVWAALGGGSLVLLVSLLGGAALFGALDERLSWPEDLAGEAARQALLLVCMLTLLYVAAGAALAFERRPAPRPRFLAARSLAFGLAVGGIALALALAAASALGAARVVETAAAASLLGLSLSALLFLFQTGAEEVFFRGWLQPLVAARWGPWLGLVTTSVLFAAAHNVPGLTSPLAMLNTAGAGLMMGLLAFRTGSLWAPIAAHWAWNWGEQSVAGATPNPGVGPLGSIYDLDLAGQRLLSGGKDALNGALGTTLALALAVAVLVLWGPPRRR